MRDRNILVTAIARAMYFGCQWIIGVDFQMSPELLPRPIGKLLEQANANIVAPTDATHHPEQSAHNTIDYFIVSGTLREHIADVAVDLACGVSPTERCVFHYGHQSTTRSWEESRSQEVPHDKSRSDAPA